MKALIGSALVANGLFDWALLDSVRVKNTIGNQSNSILRFHRVLHLHRRATGNTPQQNYEYQPPETTDSLTDATQHLRESIDLSDSTDCYRSTHQPPITNNGRNSRREERPLARKLGRRSPVDIPKTRSFSDDVRRTFSHLDLLNRADFGEALSLFGLMLD